VTGETISSDSPGIAADYLLNPGTLRWPQEFGQG